MIRTTLIGTLFSILTLVPVGYIAWDSTQKSQEIVHDEMEAKRLELQTIEQDAIQKFGELERKREQGVVFNAQVQTAQKALKQQIAEANRLTDQLTVKDREMKFLKNFVTQTKTRLDNLTSKVTQKETFVKEQIVGAEKDLAIAQQDAQAAEVNYKAAMSEREQHDAEHAALKTKYSNQQKEVERVDGEIAKLAARIDASDQLEENLRKRYGQLAARVRDLDHEVNVLQHEHDLLHKRRNDLRRELGLPVDEIDWDKIKELGPSLPGIPRPGFLSL